VNAHLQHMLDLAVHGLLTELPAQLISAAVAASVTAWGRNRIKSRAAERAADGEDAR
jgi:hypothetical protein